MRKLALNKETLRFLHNVELQQVVGGTGFEKYKLDGFDVQKIPVQTDTPVRGQTGCMCPLPVPAGSPVGEVPIGGAPIGGAPMPY